MTLELILASGIVALLYGGWAVRSVLSKSPGNARMQEIAAYKDKPVAVMCRSGRRSASATKQLADAGFTQAKNVNGGIMAWEQAGLPVTH